MNRIIGKKAPDFHLKAVSGDGEDFFDVSLDTYKAVSYTHLDVYKRQGG